MLEEMKNTFDLQKKIDIVREILEASERFVIQQHGIWGDQEWVRYLKSLETKGFGTSKELLSYYGDVIESMKAIYFTATETKKADEVLNKIIARTVTFLMDEKAVWDHSAWENYVKNLQELGLLFSQQQVTSLGNLLEAGKRLYFAAFGIKSQVE